MEEKKENLDCVEKNNSGGGAENDEKTKNKLNNENEVDNKEEYDPEIVDEEIIHENEEQKDDSENENEEDGEVSVKEKLIKKEEKIVELEEELELIETEKDDFLNRLQRLQAEFSNYRKRVKKEKSMIEDRAVAGVIVDLLPVLDNFERALEVAEGEDDFNQGIKMIYKQLLNFLKKQDVEEIDALGEEFDHNYHEAVMQIDDETHESGTVIEVVQKGYIREDKVIRPAMVKVAR